jgi:hypothetical protein
VFFVWKQWNDKCVLRSRNNGLNLKSFSFTSHNYFAGLNLKKNLLNNKSSNGTRPVFGQQVRVYLSICAVPFSKSGKNPIAYTRTGKIYFFVILCLNHWVKKEVMKVTTARQSSLNSLDGLYSLTKTSPSTWTLQ